MLLYKRKMMIIGLKVDKKIAVETHDEIKTIDQDKLMKKPFSAKESMLLFEFYKNNNLFDYIQSVDSLTLNQRAKIYDLSLKGIYTNLQFYMLAAELKLNEE